MRKLAALIHNELTKAIRRPFMLVLLIILLAGMFGLALLLKSSADSQTAWNYRPSPEERLKRAKEMLESLQKMNESDKGSQDSHLKLMQFDAEAQIEVWQMIVDSGIDPTARPFLSELIEQLIRYTQAQKSLAGTDQPDAPRDITGIKLLSPGMDISELPAAIDRLREAIQKADIQAYIDYQRQLLEQDSSLIPEEKAFRIEQLALLAYMPGAARPATQEEHDNFQNAITAIQQNWRNLYNGVDFDSFSAIPRVMTPLRRAQIEQQMAMQIFAARNGLTASINSQSFASSADTLLYVFGLWMIICAIVILAGSTVSQEIANGSVKSLIIAPVRRSKIFVSKLIAIILVALSLGGVLVLWQLFLTGPLFHLSTPSADVYALGTHAFALARPLSLALQYLMDMGQIIFYICFALMLSTVTRNTAVSVALPLTASLGSIILTLYVTATRQTPAWQRFLPTSHFDLMRSVFGNSRSLVPMLGGNITVPGSSASSLLYLTIVMFCLAYIAFDSFTRRDI